MAGFFGSSSFKKRQMFDPYSDAGPIDPGMSMPGYDPTDPSQDSPADPGIKHKTGFFGSGGVGRGIAGSIGDFLLQMNHMQPVYAPAMEHQRNLQDHQQMAQLEKEAAYSQFVREQQYRAAHPAPPEPTETERLVTYYHSIGRDDLAEAAKAKPALTTVQGVDPATNQPIIQAINPAKLFPQQGQAAPQIPVSGMTDDQIAELERRAQGGATPGSRGFPGFWGKRY